MLKIILKTLATVLTLVIVYFVLSAFNLLPDFLNFKNIFRRNELKIEPTTLIIENVTPLAQLFTSTYYAEFPISDSKETDAYFGLSKTNNELILIAKGHCFAGTDLSKLTKEDIQISDSSACKIQLPNAEIIDVVMNPSDFEIYKDDGVWTPQEVGKLKAKAKDLMQEKAIKENVLKKANERSIELFNNVLKSLGYKKVIIELKMNPNSIKS